MVNAVIGLSIIAALLGIVLAVTSEKLKTEKDPKVTAVAEALPGINCGACGYLGCDAFAEAVVKGEVSIDKCSPAKGTSDVKIISEILGMQYYFKNEGNEGREVPQLLCSGGDANCRNQFEYGGVEDCKAAARFYGGYRACSYGCLGLGTCERVCSFNVITIDSNRLPEIDYNLCMGCGKCVEDCPQDVLKMVSVKNLVHVRCINLDKGNDAKEQCSSACIKCGECENRCPEDAIKVRSYDGGSVADIDYEKCTNCGACVEACPVNVITISEPIPEKRPEIENGSEIEHECPFCVRAGGCSK